MLPGGQALHDVLTIDAIWHKSHRPEEENNFSDDKELTKKITSRQRLVGKY